MRPSKKQLIWTAIFVAIIAVGYLLSTGGKDTVTQNTVEVKRGNIVQEVSVTGRVKPTSTVNLGFEKNGRVTELYEKVGGYVERGATLAVLESSSAEGSLREAEARLAELKRGSRPEELVVKEAELAKYTQDLANGYLGVSDTINDAYNKSDDAVHTKTTGVFSGSKVSSYKYTFQVCDSQLALSGEWLRFVMEGNLDTWRAELNKLQINASSNELTTALNNASKYLEDTRVFLESVNRSLTLDCSISNASLDTYRTNINTARSNIATVISNVNLKKQSITTLALAVAKVENELSLMKAGTASEVLSAQEARVLSLRGDLAKYKIVSPLSGVITKADIKVGESSVVGSTVFSIISSNSFEIEANVPEADIAKIKSRDEARVTLDAYGSDVVFPARVVSIDPAETIIDNVPTYKVTLYFTKGDPRIKSGMTANIDIRTASREQVLFVPERSIITKDGQKFVRKATKDNETSDVVVTVGLKGSDGSIEILSGISSGENIIMSPKD